MKPRRHSLRVQMATQYALVTLIAGIVFVAVNFGAVERNTSGLTDALVGLAVITVVAVVAGWGIAQYALRPVQAVTEQARQISASSLHQRIGLEGPVDELQQLATTIDDLLSRLEASFDRERRFVANASHEIRTPLAVTRTALELGLNNPAPTVDELRDVMSRALEATGRSETLAADLLLLAQSESVDIGRRDRFDLADVARGVVDDLTGFADAGQVDISVDLAPAPIWGNAALIDRLIANLVDNAVRHNERGGWVEVATGTTNGRATLVVRNHTRGRSREPVDCLFEPFRRGAAPPGRASAAGHGLGLSIVRAIAGGHGAELSASRGEAGDVFRLEIRFDSHGDEASPSPFPSCNANVSASDGS